ncbi:RluA family pseudouridine synthase [Bdellovibrio sp. HCB2-146]|uniref:RluA family pseudouridine synthase n=1 Tax=Bdellovibrio sp. HCB2-146 TaxID=3394362 RepID=UPI0039BD1AEF
MSFKILFEDEYFLVAEKPAGLPSQPTVDKKRPDFFTSLKKQVSEPPHSLNYLGLHHRLDRDTSGVMIFTKQKAANDSLADLFKSHRIQKTYLCLTSRRKMPPQWQVENFLAEYRDPKLKKIRMRSVNSGGQKAITDFRLLEDYARGMLIEAKPRTGRMHQIRVHLAEAHMGIFGDDIYPCLKIPQPPRLMLHAHALEFEHPFTHKAIRIESPMPEDMQAFAVDLSIKK